MWSLDAPDTIRGRAYKMALVNEAAQAKNLGDAWEQIIRQRLTDYEGGAWFGSTPRGRNFFWQLWTRGQDDAFPEWRSWRFPTSANPFIKPAEIEAARGELPELAFRQEYLAEFLEGEGTVFRNIRACLTAPVPDVAKHKGHQLVAGLDWGRTNDSTALSIGCVTCHEEVVLDRFTRIEFAFQRDRIAAHVATWPVESILAESNSIGQPNIEALRADGLTVEGFETTASSKPQLIQNLALAFEKQEWKWLPDEVAALELEAYEMRANANTGRPTYTAPEGMHDDTVIARALMLRKAGGGFGW
jgi:hypothetical protein